MQNEKFYAFTDPVQRIVTGLLYIMTDFQPGCNYADPRCNWTRQELLDTFSIVVVI